jgi:hypothetical protein
VYEKGRRLAAGQASKEEPNAGEIQERFGSAREALVVFAQPPLSTQPGKGTFDDPAAWEHMKASAVPQRLQEIGSIPLHLPPPRTRDLEFDT